MTRAASSFAIAFHVNGGCLVTDIHGVNLQLAVEGETAALVVRYASEGGLSEEPSARPPLAAACRRRPGPPTRRSATARQHRFRLRPYSPAGDGITLTKPSCKKAGGSQPCCGPWFSPLRHRATVY